MPLQLRLLVGLLALLALLAARHLHRYQRAAAMSSAAPPRSPAAAGSKQRAAGLSKTTPRAARPASTGGAMPLLFTYSL